MKKFFLTIFLASCATKPDATISSKLHQPPVLILAPNTTIQTIDGLYTSDPNNKELWFPARKVEELEKIISQF